MLRFFDIAISLLGLLICWPLLLIIYILGLFDTGAPIFRQTRVGRNQELFTLLKFRTMRVNTKSIATHLANPKSVTPIGKFLRKTKLDELPQLWNVLKGEMSLIGPRPCLINQTELIAERNARGVFQVLPGISGLAQIQGIDMSNPMLLAAKDAEMINSLSPKTYLRYVLLTLIGYGGGDRIKQDSEIK